MFNHASFIWDAADLLRGPYKDYEYGDIVLPFTVLFRLDAALAPTKKAVLKCLSDVPEGTHPSAAMLRSRAGHPFSFFNSSLHDLRSLQGDVDNLAQNLLDYVTAFSEDVRSIFDQFSFETVVRGLASRNLLLPLLQHFSRTDLSPAAVTNEEMGHIFEELINKFARSRADSAGQFFTPREVIDLMVHLLLDNDDDAFVPGAIRTVYDPTAGTGGMLTAAENRLRVLNPSIDVSLFGQEIEPKAHAICLADLAIKGHPATNIAFENTLTKPAFEDLTFNYCLSNPPFGDDWKKYREDITREHEVRGFNGRFGPGLPRVSDGSLLFLMHLVSKLREPKLGETGAGRGAIVLNGSPLFTGGAGSGESNIRKWLLENDYLEAIIGLPTDMFYNTGISTYVWIISKAKPAERKGKVQLIDGTEMFVKMRKSAGSKRKELSADNIDELVRLYARFEKSEHSKIFNNEDFFYRTITVERPLRLNYAFTPDRVERALAAKAVAKLPDGGREALARALAAAGAELGEGVVSTQRAAFQKLIGTALVEEGLALKPAVMKVLLTELSEQDEAGELVTKAGKPEASAALRDTENVPWGEDIHEYLEREVKTFVPDAWIDESKTKEGAEIPFTRHFYEYVPPRPLEEIDRDLDEVLGRLKARLEQVKA